MYKVVITFDGPDITGIYYRRTCKNGRLENLRLNDNQFYAELPTKDKKRETVAEYLDTVMVQDKQLVPKPIE